MVYDIFFKEIFLKICTYKKKVLPLQRKKREMVPWPIG